VKAVPFLRMTEEKHLGMTEVFVGALEPLFRTRGNGGVSFVEGVSARSKKYPRSAKPMRG
ncbi:hypothetical protein, partial [uncultured Alistipes sp.]|uniref:hypothetical protein n=1 Tax=uncultured Alistipes sp. TaxID=538949 RepID=UPI0026650674